MAVRTKHEPNKDRDPTEAEKKALDNAFYNAPVGDPTQPHIGIITQNVRGFGTGRKALRKWLRGWKRNINNIQVHAILVQETHMTSQQEVTAAQKYWCRIWGINYESLPEHRKFSYWSTHATPTGGVGVLLHPHRAPPGEPLAPHNWTNRWMTIRMGRWNIVNVYAPSGGSRSTRETFFTQLIQHIPDGGWTLCGGDFNCVLDPAVDRVTAGTASTKTAESAALQTLIDIHQLTDAIDIAQGSYRRSLAPDYCQQDCTYWQQNNGARLDRFYLSSQLLSRIQHVHTFQAHCPSDHKSVVLTMRRQDDKHTRNRPPPRRSLYPFKGRSRDGAMALFAKWLNDFPPRNQTWDELSDIWKEQLSRITNSRTNFNVTRSMTGECKRQDDQQIWIGEWTTWTSRDIRTFFKRVSTRNQNLDTEEIQLRPGDEATGNSTQADIMANSWAGIMSRPHGTTDPIIRTAIWEELVGDVQLPQITTTANAQLTAPITPTELQQAIDHLGRGKAAGIDGIGNDFLKDWSTTLQPILLNQYNAILQGAELPTTATQAVVIPIPKTGDLTDPMNYRPISLLTAWYRLFSRIIARRVQATLGLIIHIDQQGFIRKRQMHRSIDIMLTILDQCVTNAADPQLVLLLDFKKAYDTLNRDFLWSILRAFGYSTAFIDLVQKLHAKTTATFEYKGKRSRSIPLNSGIRQGCSLAPLLFLIAIELLGIVIRNHTRLTGITLPTGDTHKFSGFVDDSTIFLQRLSQLPIVLDVLDKFEILSGLAIQPTKCVGIPLSRTPQQPTAHRIPMLRPHERTRYLGVHIGIGDLHKVNWTLRMRTLKTRLGVASRVTNGVPSRVAIVNVIAHAGFLFTASYFLPSQEIFDQYEALIKQYITTGTLVGSENTRWPLEKATIEAPLRQGGLRLRNICSLYLYHCGKLRLTQVHDQQSKYSRALHARTNPDHEQSPSCCSLTPRTHAKTMKTLLTRNSTPQGVGHDILEDCLAMTHVSDPLRDASIRNWLQTPEAEPTFFWVTDHHGVMQFPARYAEDWRIHQERLWCTTPAEIRNYWSTFHWAHNQWIKDPKQRPLTGMWAPECVGYRLGDLNLRQTGTNRIEFEMPDTWQRPRRRKKWQKWLWMLAVQTPFYSTQSAPPVRLLHPHGNLERLHWTQRGTNWLGIELDTDRFAIFHQLDPWRPLQLRSSLGIEIPDLTAQYFEAHPRVIRTPLFERDTSHPTKRRLRQVLRKLKDHSETKMQRKAPASLSRLRKQLVANPALAPALQDTTWKEIWATEGWLGPQHTFFWYRLVSGQLKTRHGLPNTSNTCNMQSCIGQKETYSHIFWECRVAKITWMEIITKWTDTNGIDDTLRDHIFTRKAPPTAPRIKYNYSKWYGKPPSDWTCFMNVLWRALTTIIMHQLWLYRNARVYQHSLDTPLTIKNKIYAHATTHLQSLSTSWMYRRTTRDWGLLLARILPSLTGTTQPEKHLQHNYILEYASHTSKDNTTTGTAWLVTQPRTQDNFIGWTQTSGSPTNGIYHMIEQALRFILTLPTHNTSRVTILSRDDRITRQLTATTATRLSTNAATRRSILDSLRHLAHNIIHTANSHTEVLEAAKRATRNSRQYMGPWRCPPSVIPPTDRPPPQLNTSRLIEHTLRFS